jgi:hypothetical protein
MRVCVCVCVDSCVACVSGVRSLSAPVEWLLGLGGTSSTFGLSCVCVCVWCACAMWPRYGPPLVRFQIYEIMLSYIMTMFMLEYTIMSLESCQ